MATISSSGYNIYVGNNVLTLLKDQLVKDKINQKSVFILVDENTKKDCLPIFIEAIPFLKDATIIETSSGESNKNINTCVKIWNDLSAQKATRKAVLINLGGGVIGDMGGFAASTYKRGIDFIQVPTTLLSQVDSSVGGKLGIDLDTLKNQIGMFNYPTGVYVYPYFLKTLSKDQLISGYAEILKHGLINDVAYWKKIKNFNLDTIDGLNEVIETSIHIKNEIVKADPKEHGLRKLLNFGHTIGHAVESWFLANKKEPLLHGQAIAIGMVCEGFLSVKKGFLSTEELDEIIEVLFSIFPRPSIPVNSFDALLDLMKNDKKNDASEYNFTLLQKIGEGIFNQTCEAEDILAALVFYNSRIIDFVA